MQLRNLLPVGLIAFILTFALWLPANLFPDSVPLDSSKAQVGSRERVLGETIKLPIPETSQFSQITQEFNETITSSNTAPPLQKTVRVALLGDSMIDTLGDFGALKERLKLLNEDLDWQIINYGVGSSNVNYGLYRLKNEYDYLGKHYQSLFDVNPDIVIVESFAYNHGDTPENNYQEGVKRILEELKKANKKVVFLATIAPNKANYARGAADWGDEYRAKEYEKTRRFMDLATDVAKKMNVSVVNAFHASMDNDKGGNERYINHGDWIHPSPEGGQFIADLLAPVIISLVE